MSWTDVLLVLETIGVFLLNIIYIVISILKILFVPKRFLRKDINGQIALITGGGSGIGRLLSLKLSAKGATVVIWDINEKGNDETSRMVREAGGKCHTFTVDLCDRNAVYQCAEYVKKDVGKVDILINNAGIVSGRSFLETPDEAVIKTFNVNTISHFWTTKSFLPGMMKDNKGNVVTVSSVAGLTGCEKLVDYCSSKFSAVGFNESLRMELQVGGYTGINCTVVCPYFTDTGMFDGVKSRLIPMLRPEYVADQIVDGVLMDKQSIIMPTTCSFYIAFKGLMPHKGILAANYLFTGKKAMSGFGRDKKEVRVTVNS